VATRNDVQHRGLTVPIFEVRRAPAAPGQNPPMSAANRRLTQNPDSSRNEATSHLNCLRYPAASLNVETIRPDPLLLRGLLSRVADAVPLDYSSIP